MADAQPKAVKDDFHRERSRFLDAFAGLEETLQLLPSALRDKQVDEAIKALRSIRNDVVHSQLRFVVMEGQLHAFAINTQEFGKVARQARLLRIQDFKQLSEQILKAQKNVVILFYTICWLWVISLRNSLSKKSHDLSM